MNSQDKFNIKYMSWIQLIQYYNMRDSFILQAIKISKQNPLFLLYLDKIPLNININLRNFVRFMHISMHSA